MVFKYKNILIMYWVYLLNFLACCFNASAFLLQGIVHFPFMDDNYWTENMKITAQFYVIPLLTEFVTAWFNVEDSLWISSIVVLMFGWVTCGFCWYYQIHLSDYASVGTQQSLTNMARFRSFFWLLRIVILYSWFISTNK